ncbi:MAG: ProQ/FINO family protein [Alphaproteobacteria bacterium]|nr:ProQ/FINO family protein [Alphaproteobacteria bacterium]
MKENAPRIDLNGNTDGIVTKEEADPAKKRLKQYAALRAKKSASKKKEGGAQASTSTEALGV